MKYEIFDDISSNHVDLNIKCRYYLTEEHNTEKVIQNV